VTGAVGFRRQRQRPPLAQETAQDGVDQAARRAALDRLREIDGRVDGGELRHAVELDDLEQREPQQCPHVRIETARLAAEARQDVIEKPLPGERAVDELCREGAVARVQLRAAERAAQDGVGEGAVLDGGQHSPGEAARLSRWRPQKPGGE